MGVCYIAVINAGSLARPAIICCVGSVLVAAGLPVNTAVWESGVTLGVELLQHHSHKPSSAIVPVQLEYQSVQQVNLNGGLALSPSVCSRNQYLDSRSLMSLMVVDVHHWLSEDCRDQTPDSAAQNAQQLPGHASGPGPLAAPGGPRPILSTEISL